MRSWKWKTLLRLLQYTVGQRRKAAKNINQDNREMSPDAYDAWLLQQPIQSNSAECWRTWNFHTTGSW